MRAKKQLLRLAASPTGVRFDHRQRLDGRGAYICPDPDCITKAADRGGRAVRRALRGASEDEVRAALTQARSPHRTMRSEHA